MKKIFFVFSLAFELFNVQAQINLSSSLTACYSLDGNATEFVNSLTGTLSAVTATVDRFGNLSSALSFSGAAVSSATTSSFLKLPSSSLIKPNILTFSAWVKSNTLGATIVFADNGCVSNQEGYGLFIQPGSSGYKFRITQSSSCTTQVLLVGVTSVSINTWYHVAFYAGPDSLKLYVNGILENKSPSSGALSYTSTNVYLGSTQASVDLPLDGSLDNVKFYNRKLNDSEINQLYTQDPSCNPVPVSAFSVAPTSVCAGGTVSLTDLSTNSPNSWSWQTNGAISNSTTAQAPVLTYTSAGIYSISLVATNSVGIGSTIIHTIAVLPNPTVSISAPQSLCAGHSATLTATGGTAYAWSSGQTTSQITLTPVQNTTYTVVVNGANGCNSSMSSSLAVNPLPSITISGNTTICQGLSTTLLASGSALTYSWINGNTVGSLITVTPSISTNYTVTGTTAYGCTATTSQIVSVNPQPFVTINANSTSACVGDPVTLNGMGASTYTWTGGITNNVAFYPGVTTVYTVTGTGTNGCKNVATITLQVNNLPILNTTANPTTPQCSGEAITLSAFGANTYIWSTGAITPFVSVVPVVNTNYTVTGTDGNGCKASAVISQMVNICAGVQSYASEKNFEIYPNPSNGKFVIEVVNAEIKTYTVVNLLGAEVLKGSIEGLKSTLDLGAFQNGIYFLRIGEGANSELVKIVKE